MAENEAVINEVRVVGRLSAPAQGRELPSGDTLVQLRVVVPRPLGAARRSKVTVDTIDVVAWTAKARRQALRLHAGDMVEVTGALRRRFFRAGAAAVSRYEVEAAGLRRFS